jgi:predicted MFS family arabinose efflux permease
VTSLPSDERGRRAAIVVAFGVAYFLSFFYRSTNALIAEDLARDVGLGASALGLMTSVFFLAFAAVQLPLGSALDRFGPRFVTSSLLLAGVLGSLVFAAADTTAGLALGRALIGIGMAGVLMGAMKAFASWFEPRAFATVSGIFVGVGSLGALTAATPLALLTSAFGWRAVFVGAAVVTLATALLLALVVREPRGGGYTTSSGGADGGFADVFRRPAFWSVAAIAFASAGILFAFQGLWAGPFLMQRLGYEQVAAGNVLLVMGVAMTTGFLSAGPLSARIGLARACAAGGLLLLVSLLALLAAGPTWPTWAVAVVFAGLGAGGSVNVLCYALARALFPTMPGRAVTAVNVFAIGGGALLQWGLGVIIGAFPPLAGRPSDLAFSVAVATSAAIALAALLAFAPLVRSAAGEPRSARS